MTYNQWFRDENLQPSVFVTKGDGPDSTVGGFDGYPLRRRGKRHDYFTSCLPWPQKGDAVTLPLGDFANVTPVGSGIPIFAWPVAPATPVEIIGTAGGDLSTDVIGAAGRLCSGWTRSWWSI